ncbi:MULTISPECIES: inositol-3-phosphate synthase [Streptomyces]|uniref:inositol-3-phosphate synthase n=1 Tax=Streptomyces TaxID=1883 RepID=UPI000F793568|nr:MULTISPECIES: inositol-3-phosphate synthase [Streptomyces]RST05787.1 myo-inositol-1-phosphate synthase [Streptomyces sp. WAC07149]GLX21348.1 myo-inositol-1-phosphate synthase [Streptomyces lavendulae subsp. lavendulae]GLX27866.1 myo-inositol-1-phosphate synthase [Streptomyces lavendulae subsp. lavendulae]
MRDTTGSAPRIGVWMVGARGSVATAAVAGAAAVVAGAASPVGCVTETPPFADAPLPALADLVFGGHDVVGTPLSARARQLVDAGVLPASVLGALDTPLAAAELEIRDGSARPGEPQSETAARLAEDMAAFRDRHALEQVVVVNVSSTEPLPDPDPAFLDLAALEAGLAAGTVTLPASSLYAYAAFTAGCSYVNFTPSAGAALPALEELSRLRRVPHAGRDGKTGETLVKSALAPMFTQRALRLRSWSGTNLLGGGDGATLADPAAARSKTESKQRALEDTVGHAVQGQTHIDNVPEMGEWKTAWDHISFEGFLGVRMTMQFTWQGCDSALAAPLVLDLVRLTALAARRGEAGALSALGFFFKDPAGSAEHNLTLQYETLRAWATAPATAPAPVRPDPLSGARP